MKPKLSILALVAFIWFAFVACVNSPERTAKITTDTLLAEVSEGELIYAKDFIKRQDAARAAKDLAKCDELVKEQGRFNQLVADFQNGYRAALFSYLAVKETAGTNSVTVQDLSNFASDFGSALTNLQTFIKTKR